MSRPALTVFLSFCVACASPAPATETAPDAAPSPDAAAWPELDVASGPDVRYDPDSFDRGAFDDPAPCDAVHVRRVAPWPGGVQITVSAPGADLLGSPVAVEDLSGALVAAAVAPAPGGPGLTGLLVVPSADASVHAARLAAAQAALDALPEGERVAVWADGLEADLTDDRAHVRERIAAIHSTGVASVVAARAALTKAAPGGPPHRTLIVVGEMPPPDPVVAPVTTVPVPDGADAGALVEAALAERAGAVVVAACVAAPEGAPLALRVAGARCDLTAPPPVADLPVACDPVAAAADDWPYGDTLTIDLTAEEQATWDARWKARSREPFTAHVRLGPGAPMAAVIHFRGSTSIKCDRKSIAVNLDGGDNRRLMPGGTGDKMTLLSMCMDDGYVQTAWVDRVLGRLGLYPVGLRYVRLTVAGKNHGVYLLSQNVKDFAAEQETALTMLLRRGNEQGGKPAEVDLPDPDADPQGAAAALAVYDELRALAKGQDADARVRERFALDDYLRWMAWNTLVRNGDYVDEVFLLGSVEAGATYFQFIPWDPDDVFSDCHGAGAYAVEEPSGLLYCAEADLDHAIVEDPAIHARYVKAMRLVLEQASDELLAATMAQVRAELWQVLADDETAAAMGELVAEDPGAAKVDHARVVIQARMDAMLAEAAARRKALQQKVDALE